MKNEYTITMPPRHDDHERSAQVSLYVSRTIEDPKPHSLIMISGPNRCTRGLVQVVCVRKKREDYESEYVQGYHMYVQVVATHLCREVRSAFQRV